MKLNRLCIYMGVPGVSLVSWLLIKVGPGPPTKPFPDVGMEQSWTIKVFSRSHAWLGAHNIAHSACSSNPSRFVSPSRQAVLVRQDQCVVECLPVNIRTLSPYWAVFNGHSLGLAWLGDVPAHYQIFPTVIQGCLLQITSKLFPRLDIDKIFLYGLLSMLDPVPRTTSSDGAHDS